MRELKRTTLLDSSVQAPHQAFFEGHLGPGEHLSEPTLSKRLGLSRSTVREALRRLEQQGWVTRMPFKGSFVRVLNGEELISLNSLRATPEAFAAELVIERATHDQIAGLSDIVEQMESAASNGRIRRALEPHFAFHEMPCLLSGHSSLHRH